MRLFGRRVPQTSRREPAASPPQPDAPFKDRDHSGITTVDALQTALTRAGLDPFDCIIWDEDRGFVPAFGIHIVTLLEDGTYSLDIRDRGDVNHRGTYTTEAEAVSAYLAEADPRRPPATPEPGAGACVLSARPRGQHGQARTHEGTKPPAVRPGDARARRGRVSPGPHRRVTAGTRTAARSAPGR